MNTISLKLTNEEITKLQSVFRDSIVKNDNPYIKTFIKADDVTISIYTSNKVVFQGKDAHLYAAGLMKKDHPMAGSDEVGTGDYFGPVCVCAAIVEVEDYAFLNELGVDDSKQITDELIMKIAPKIMERLKYSLLILQNNQYNKVHETNNMNKIKAKMHNQAYINLLHKGYTIPKAAYVDQFEDKQLYFNHIKDDKEVYRDLTFETKAESKYIAVAAASVIARYAFIKSFDAMSKAYNFDFIKGAGDNVDQCGAKFVKQFGQAKLFEVAKLHFKNTEKIMDLCK